MNNVVEDTKSKKTYSNNNKRMIEEYKRTNSVDLRNEIIVANINLVRKVAKLYINKSILEQEELVHEGIMGLITAIEKFDINKNTSFSTYAYYWIRQSMDRAITTRGQLIRVPSHVTVKVNKLKALQEAQLMSKGEVDRESICTQMEIDMEEYRKLERIYNNYQAYLSLNVSIDENGESEDIISLIDNKSVENLGIDNTYDLEKELNKLWLNETLEEALESLLPKEEKVLRLRYGFDNGEFKTLEQVGQQFELTRERIRQIEAKALRKLNHYTRIKYLEGFKGESYN